jgi:hypothetical protein
MAPERILLYEGAVRNVAHTFAAQFKVLFFKRRPTELRQLIPQPEKL